MWKSLTYYQETFEMIIEKKYEIAEKFEKECMRLLKSGGIDRESHSRGLLFGMALENMADNYLMGDRKTKEYKNLKHF